MYSKYFMVDNLEHQEKNDQLVILSDSLKAMEAMKDVEKHYRENPNMTGEQKLNMALEIIKKSSANLNVTISDKDINDLIKYINDTIKWANDMKK